MVVGADAAGVPEGVGLGQTHRSERTPSQEDNNVEGLPGHLTPEQTTVLEALRATVTDEELDKLKYDVEEYDWVLCRYLRARKWNLADTTTMIRESLARREADKPWEFVSQGPDVCLGCPERVFKKIYPHFYHGFDKFGRPVVYDRSGLLDVAGLLCLTDVAHMIRYHWYTMGHVLAERYREAKSRGLHSPRLGLVSVLDLQGLGSNALAREVYSYLKEVSLLDQLCFPELLGKLLIINAPVIFSAVWSVCRVWLDPKTVSKIEIISSPAAWKQRLLQLIPTEDLPSDYGGSGPTFGSEEAAEHGQEEIESFSLKPRGSAQRKFPVKLGQSLTTELYLGFTTDVDITISSIKKGGKEVVEWGPERPPASKDKEKEKRHVIRKQLKVEDSETEALVVTYRNRSMLSSRHIVVVNSIEEA